MRLLRTTWTLLAALALRAAVAGPALGAGVDLSALTPEDLLAAVPPLSEVAGVVATPADWWPTFPDFHVGPLNPAPRPGERFYIAQRFSRCDDPERSHLEVTVVLLTSRKQAHRAFVDLSSETAQGATVLKGTRLGDESRYFAHAGVLGSTTLRYRVGPLVGRVTLTAPGAPASAEGLSKYGAALVAKLQSLLAGKLAAPNLPTDFAAAMPPAAAATEIGPILASAVVPVEAWALADSANDPVRVRDLLKAGGVTNLYYRLYAAQSVPGHVLEATLFQFKDAEAATRWVRLFIHQVATKGPVYDPGETGVLRAFTSTQGRNYELQFAKGRLVGEVVGRSPFGELSPACQPLVRRLAELWWPAVPVK